ncbi:MAG: ATP-binding protein [Pseudomonadota bacterium]
MQPNHTSINENFIPFGFIEWDVPTDTITLCPYLAELLAFQTKESIQTYSAYRQLTHPDDIEPIERLTKEIRDRKETYIVVESRKLCRDGTWRWFSLRGKIIKKDTAGNPLHAMGTCTDITTYKEKKLKLKNIELIFSEIEYIKKCNQKCTDECNLSNILQKELCAGTFICTEIVRSLEKITNSTNAIFLFSSSPNFEKNKNVTLHDHNRKNIENLSLSLEKLHFIKTLQFSKNHLIQASNEKSLLGIYLNLPFDQYGIIILEQDIPFENDTLSFLAPFIEVITHIISFRKIEIDNNKLDSIVSFFIKQVPAQVAMFDTNMCYKFASEAWCKAYNLCDLSDLIGKSAYEIAPQQPKKWRELHLRGLAGEIVLCEAEQLFEFSDKPIWIEWAIHPWYTLNQSIGGIIIYANDITKRVNDDLQLKESVDNLTRSNQALDRFAHICSHDLKEPLRGISNFIQLLIDQNSENLDNTSLSYMHYILKNTHRMKILIKDILSYAELSHQSGLKKIPLNMNTVVHEIVDMFNYRLSETDADIKVGNLPVILGIESQIEQLITNLISNAFKFKSDRPLVLNIFALDCGSFWEFHVQDNGIGIEEEDHKNIFSAFKRLHSKNQYEGSGIGLATCQKIVNEHLGDIYIQSMPEGGSDFVFTLPKVNDENTHV